MIPGSSIKGAIRTALLWDLIGDSNQESFKDAVNYLKGQLDENRIGVGRDKKLNSVCLGKIRTTI